VWREFKDGDRAHDIHRPGEKWHEVGREDTPQGLIQRLHRPHFRGEAARYDRIVIEDVFELRLLVFGRRSEEGNAEGVSDGLYLEVFLNQRQLRGDLDGLLSKPLRNL